MADCEPAESITNRSANVQCRGEVFDSLEAKQVVDAFYST